MRSIFEKLETRKMLDGNPLMFLRGQGTGAGDQHLRQGWSMVVEMNPDGYPNLIITNDDGERLALPTVKFDGSVTLNGSEEADQITVERVDSLDGADPHELGLAYFQTPDGPVAVSQPFFDVDVFKPFVDQLAQNLQDAHTRDDPKYLANVEQQNRMANAALEELKIPHSYIHYRLAGFYDVYVEMNDQMTPNSRIRIDGAGGNDEIAIANNVPMKASLGGGPGADKITSGSRTSMLYGGGGSDRLFSRSKHGGTLDGGKGADRYYNRYGEVQIMARSDGDSVVVNNSPVAVAQCGTLGVESGSGRCYFLTETDKGQIDLLA